MPSTVDPVLVTLCVQSLRGLEGQLRPAYELIAAQPEMSLPVEARAWRDSELGEMAERLGDDAAAERWFRAGLALSPTDLYMRNALADLLLRHGRPEEALVLLVGYESMEPMRLRIAIAQKMLGSPQLSASRAMLAAAFEVEERRGDAVHRREQARFLLDVEGEPAAALAVAEANWSVQREPDDLLILLRAAQAAGQPAAAAPAQEFIAEHRIEDSRLRPYLPATPS
jgi:predicted Zn-dependent protease